MNTQFAIPDAGCRIAVTFEFPSYVIGTSKVSKTTISGIVEKATKHTPPNFVRIATDFDSPVRVREISLYRITNIEYADGRQATIQLTEDESKTWTVQGSRGSQYVVVRSKNSWSCNCPGFQFRRSCKHVTQIKGN
jgi:hypothetical protein